jgi:Flp pilus assembly protein TadD
LIKENLKRIALLVLLLSLTSTASSQSTDASKHATRNASLNKARVEDKKDSGSGEYWFSRGYELHQSDRYPQAIEAFAHSIGLRYRQATAMYNIACGFAMLDDKDNALFWLERALVAGFDRTDLLKNDSDLDPLRSDPRFREILQKASFTKSQDKSSKENDRFQEAISNFEQLSRESSQDGNQWYKVGSRLIRLRDFDRAVTALTRAIDHLGYQGASAMYNLACAYALKGDRGPALDWLEKSVNAGFDDTEKLREDPDIASLRSEPRFKKIEELSRVLSLSQFSDGEFDDSHYPKRRWAPAIQLYETFLRKEPENGRGWFDLGYALHYSTEHEKAIQAFERAIQFGYRKPTSMYNIACANAMMGRRDAAFEWLDKSAAAGFEIGNYISGDSDLDGLRSDPRFERFLDISNHEHKVKEKNEK